MGTINTIRRMRDDEAHLLNDFLYEAIFQVPGNEPLPKDIVNTPEIAIYAQDFGRDGDFGLVAEVNGQVVGLAWSRILAGEIKGYGFIDNGTPELAISVLPAYRGAGLGSALLKELMCVLKTAGYKKLSLSVAKLNQALSLYERAGFKLLNERDEDFLMIAHLDHLITGDEQG